MAETYYALTDLETRLKEFESYYGKAMRLDARTNYCPNCGADMRVTDIDVGSK